MADHVYDLRARRSLRVLASAFRVGAQRFGVRIVELSVQGNHMHLLVESPDHVSLGRAMKGLGVRIAHRMNRLMEVRGQVIGDRYYARRLRTPTEVRRTIHYLRNNHRHHGIARFAWPALAALLPSATLWLVTASYAQLNTG